MRCLLAVCLAAAVLAGCDRPSSPKTQAAGLPETAAQKAEHWWTCGGVDIKTEMQGEMLVLSGPFGERALPAQASASGARYADDKGNEFWNEGEAARLKLDWKEVGECKEDKAS